MPLAVLIGSNNAPSLRQTIFMEHLPGHIAHFLLEPFALSEAQICFYRKNRFIKLKEVLSPDVVAYFNEVISGQVAKMKHETRSLGERDTYGKAFLQLFNLWRHDARIQALVLSPRLGQIAAGLMQCNGVRLYHDQALFKEPGGGYTPWHADQFYWPLQTDKCVTAWIPLQAIPIPMGPLEFSAGSHVVTEGRELAIGDESEITIGERLRVADFEHVVEPFDVGEISFHSGWVFHRAGPNSTSAMRKVMTVIYMDSQMKLKAPENSNQQADWDAWCPGAQIDAVINTPLNPLIYAHTTDAL